MLERVDDTIVAISSAPGAGTLGIVRLSGPDAIPIVDSFAATATGQSLADQPGSTRIAGDVLIQPDITLPADFYVFRAPHSYTRQDLVEIHTVGSPAALELVRGLALARGAVAAEPGEFTARAFINGAMDLAAAEAVAGVIRAKSDAQLRASRRMMDGEFAKRILEARDQLAELLGLVEADIDFAEEPIDFIKPTELRERLERIEASLALMVQRDASIERLDVLPQILLFGPPNVGKSSLMNRLSGTRRSICAAAAGITRDILSAPIRIGRWEAILLDTAGVDSSPDEIIARAREMTLLAADRVDLLCVVLDATADDCDQMLPVVQSLRAGKIVVAVNKCDLVSGAAVERLLDTVKDWHLGSVCAVSALTGDGIDLLRREFVRALGGRESTTASEAVVLTERQSAAVRTTSQAVRRAIVLAEQAVETIDCADLLAFELREALDSLGLVTGEVTTEDLLSQVFANFCIGK